MKKLLTIAMALGLWLMACSGDEEKQQPAVRDGGTEPSSEDGGAGEECPFGRETCGPCLPEEPRLPDCLKGDDPPGCAELPACLQGDNPPGCAAPPELPRFDDWDCPDGWLQKPAFVDEEGNENPPEGVAQFNICEPPPPPEDCPEGSMPLLGKADCQLIGDPCPAGDWPENIPATATVVYVKAGAALGDGSPENPFATLRPAYEAAETGAVIAIASGIYSEELTIAKEITLWGACVTGVTIAGAASEILEDPDKPETILGVIHVVAGGKATVKSLKITGDRTGLRVLEGGELTAEGVWVDRATSNGVSVRGSVLLANSFVTNTQPAKDTGIGGSGSTVLYGGHAKITNSSFEGNRVVGVAAYFADTTLEATGVLVRNTLGQASDKGGGNGIQVFDGATAKLAQVLLEKNRQYGLIISSWTDGEPAKGSLSRVVIRDTLADEAEGVWGQGLLVDGLAEVTADQILLDRNRESALQISTSIVGLSPKLDVTRIVANHTQANNAEDVMIGIGRGLSIANGAIASVSQAILDRNISAGIFAMTDPQFGRTQVTLSDVVARDTQSNAVGPNSGTQGLGMSVIDGVDLSLQRGVFERNHHVGVAAMRSALTQESPLLTLEDITVRNTLSTEIDIVDTAGKKLRGGVGFLAGNGARVIVNRGAFDSNDACGITAGNLELNDTPVQLELSDITVRDNRVAQGEDQPSAGMEFDAGVIATIERAVLQRNHTSGIFLHPVNPSFAPPQVVMREALIADMLAAETGDLAGFAVGIVVKSGGLLRLEKSLIARANSAAISVYSKIDTAVSAVELEDVVIRDTQPMAEGAFAGLGGVALAVSGGGKAMANRIVFENNRQQGVLAYSLAGETPAELLLSDALIRNTIEVETGAYAGKEGRGLDVENGAKVIVSRTVFDGNHDIGVFAGMAAVIEGASEIPPEVSLTDVLIRNTASRSFDGKLGRGLGVQEGAKVTATRLLLEGNQELGVSVMAEPANQAAIFKANELIVRNTRFAACAESTCLNHGSGTGIGLFGNVQVELTGFYSHDNALAGLQIARDGVQLTAIDGTLTSNEWGANIQTQGFDRKKALFNVHACDNRSLDDASADLPIPSAAEVLQQFRP